MTNEHNTMLGETKKYHVEVSNVIPRCVTDMILFEISVNLVNAQRCGALRVIPVAFLHRPTSQTTVHCKSLNKVCLSHSTNKQQPQHGPSHTHEQSCHDLSHTMVLHTQLCSFCFVFVFLLPKPLEISCAPEIFKTHSKYYVHRVH